MLKTIKRALGLVLEVAGIHVPGATAGQILIANADGDFVPGAGGGGGAHQRPTTIIPLAASITVSELSGTPRSCAIVPWASGDAEGVGRVILRVLMRSGGGGASINVTLRDLVSGQQAVLAAGSSTVLSTTSTDLTKWIDSTNLIAAFSGVDLTSNGAILELRAYTSNASFPGVIERAELVLRGS